MELVTSISELRQRLVTLREQGKRIGFVPTMGALHRGHAELITTAARDCPAVVVSIFVNPTQFGPNEDFARYPRTLDDDRQLCESSGCGFLFAPSVTEMYPEGTPRTSIEVSELDRHLCGASRPGHFRGVCLVVMKLLQIVQADRAYFGEKDAQQLRIIQRMAVDLNVPTQICPVPTVRESDGLALSSRNRYLSAVERAAAPAIYQALVATRSRAENGERDVSTLENFLHSQLVAIPGAAIDYARLVDDVTLAPITTLDCPALAATAVRLGETRLIDNVRIVIG